MKKTIPFLVVLALCTACTNDAKKERREKIFEKKEGRIYYGDTESLDRKTNKGWIRIDAQKDPIERNGKKVIDSMNLTEADCKQKQIKIIYLIDRYNDGKKEEFENKENSKFYAEPETAGEAALNWLCKNK